MSLHHIGLLAALGLGLAGAPAAFAQPAQAPIAATAGTLVIVPADGEVTRANDEATVSFAVEEQDKDRAAATARANQKMKQGTDLVRAQDPQAELKTTGYYTYPVYPEVPDNPRPLANAAARRVPIGWRVGQSLQVTTKRLAALPKTVAGAQKVLNLNGIDYHLSRELTKTLDDERIAAAYRNLNERIGSIARAMGRNPGDAVIDTVDLEGSGRYGGESPLAQRMVTVSGMRAKSAEMPEPSFEAGETTLNLHLVGKVRFR
jgi:uncharacterized protein YggE